MKHLNDPDRRLDQASEEVRTVARHSSPPSLPDRANRSPRAWLVFAAAFGAVALAVGAMPLLFGSGDPDVAGRPSTTQALPVTTTWPVTTTGSEPATTAPPGAADCSAAGMTMPKDQEGLPEEVASMRRAIAEAAIACDFATLEDLAGPDLVTSFGGGDFLHLVELEESGNERPLAILVGLFDTPYASEDYEDLPRHYYWPSALVYDTWNEIPETDIAALLEVFTEEELDQIATFGSYAGWRIGITEDGDWRFFVAGD
jgi:hypothetical protein